MKLKNLWKYGFCALTATAFVMYARAQTAPAADSIRIPPRPTMEQIMKDWGPNDLTKIGAIWYGTDYNSFKMMPFTEEENIWISKLPRPNWSR
ncbi:hypothetical protein [Niabella hibiscisoli]|uniref:hypothetical protein n=1 Tax=Niabella hibiscisoli TaxID=1825928 RepID=UPI001F0CFEA9|nr:hypothetical protein [Niabella hibiscisoli]MCH5720624.1 hypothetical protein [Niabella hibiscisoli]